MFHVLWKHLGLAWLTDWVYIFVSMCVVIRIIMIMVPVIFVFSHLLKTYWSLTCLMQSYIKQAVHKIFRMFTKWTDTKLVLFSHMLSCKCTYTVVLASEGYLWWAATCDEESAVLWPICLSSHLQYRTTFSWIWGDATSRTLYTTYICWNLWFVCFVLLIYHI